MELSYYTNFSSSLTQQESLLNTLQEEISSGVAVTTPDQNPAAYETATLGTDQISALNSETTTQADIQGQLGSVNNVYQSVGTLFNNVQSVLEEALNGTTSAQNMQSLATEVTSAGQQLVGLANTTGTNGTYLFGGSRGTVQPFQTVNGTVMYMGDGGQSQAAISPDSSSSTIANGETFMSGLEGDGYASVMANTANTGTAYLVSQGPASPSAATAFQQSNPATSAITVNFTSGPTGLTYTTTQNGTTSAAAPVTAGMTLQLGGVDFELSGTPASGDSFTVAPSRPQSAFQLLQSITTTLSNSGSSSAQSAQTRQQLNQDLSSLAQYQQSVTTAAAQNGVTLQAVTSAGNNDSSQQAALQTSVQNAVAVNMPTALTSLDETMTAVQAAMKAFSSVQSLSLFSYI
jgi:flagellar hook-associated protein 3 FlgL